MLKIVALDFDGTLVESNNIKDKVFDTIFSEWPDHRDHMMRWHLENNAIDREGKFRHFVENVLGQINRSELVDELVKRFSLQTMKNVSECEYVSGAVEFLELFYRHYPVYLLSATPQKDLDKILKLRRLEHYFVQVYGAPIKKASVLKDIAVNNMVCPNQIVYIGDSPEDKIAAEEAGTQFIGRRSDRNLATTGIPLFSDMNGVKEYVET